MYMGQTCCRSISRLQGLHEKNILTKPHQSPFGMEPAVVTWFIGDVQWVVWLILILDLLSLSHSSKEAIIQQVCCPSSALNHSPFIRLKVLNHNLLHSPEIARAACNGWLVTTYSKPHLTEAKKHPARNVYKLTP